jgi:hypothetical protein
MDYGATTEAEEAAAVPQAEHKVFERPGSDSEAPNSPSGLFTKAMHACFGAAAKNTSPVWSACAKPKEKKSVTNAGSTTHLQTLGTIVLVTLQ